jgi:S-DNA-T family DNA segregation ATPase FtsK/SpoIIIE
MSANLFLVLDDWAAFRKDFEELTDQVLDIAQRGLGYGVHVIITSGRWADFRLPMQSVLGTVIELKINDALDFVVGRRHMEKLQTAPTGRVLTSDTLQSQLALPTFGESTLVPGSAGQDLVRAVSGARARDGAPAVRMLPDKVTYGELRAQDKDAAPAIVGLAEADLEPVRFDLESGQRHVLIYGDSGSGKSYTLRVLIDEVLRDARPGQVMFGVIDTRRALLGYIHDDYLGGYGGTRKSSELLVEGMRRELERRLPPSDVTVEQLRNRSWWNGPEMYIVVDDFDMVEGSQNPLRPLIPYLAQAADIGLHVIVARRSAGAGRAGYESVLQALRDAVATGVLLSGDRQEGQIWPSVKFRRFPPGRA